MKMFSSMENQTRNLTTILLGSTLYAILYAYIGSIDFNNNYIYEWLFHIFSYIFMFDAWYTIMITMTLGSKKTGDLNQNKNKEIEKEKEYTIGKKDDNNECKI